MPKDEFDFEDPMELLSCAMPAAGPEMEREMARCLAEEFIRMGTPEEDLLEMFRDPFYSVLHGVYQSLGEAAVRDLIAQARAGWGPIDESGRNRHAEGL
ncbi:MAG: hypothetical protein HYY21_10230 [Candidatus Tectomicrobia bacterium]|nr:hypothetical protein [Candidatus Tectomicrobia bacterium]